ncbi:DUF3467 domain-containing protein [Methylobacterium oryzihabitans]|nr:DUF3467 domain-containing protein [Methylobacterium oryzihabitans]
MAEGVSGAEAMLSGGNAAATPTTGAQPEMRVDTTQLKTTYCNVCSATSTSEEVVLTYGFNSNWDMRQQPMEIALHHRIVMSPKAAKRFHGVLTQLIAEHEARNGPLA